MTPDYLLKQKNDPDRIEIPWWLKEMIMKRFVDRPYRIPKDKADLVYDFQNLFSDIEAFNKKQHNGFYQNDTDHLRGAYGGRKNRLPIKKTYRDLLCLYASDLKWDELCQREGKTEDENYYDPAAAPKPSQKEKKQETARDLVAVLAGISQIQEQIKQQSADFSAVNGELSAIREQLETLEETVNEQSSIEPQTINHIHYTQNNLYQLIVDAESKYYYQYINPDFWDEQKADDPRKLTSIGLRYFTRIDVRYAAKAVANDLIVEPEEVLNVTRPDGQKEQLTFTELLQHARSGDFSLIRVMADGGFGKSSYLWWIARTYYPSYHIFFIDKTSIEAAAKLLADIRKIILPQPIMIIIDDFADKEAARLLKPIKDYTEKAYLQCVVVLAERTGRFQFNRRSRQMQELEYLFEEGIWTIHYQLYSKKTEIFERVYPLLADSETKRIQESTKQASSIFNDNKLTSIAESIYQLICYLKKEGETTYEFDWIDWDRLVRHDSGKYGELEQLFHLTVCFFQFGIGLPLAFVNEFYGKADLHLKIVQAIGKFAENSPLRLSTEGFTSVGLRNEYVATWYLAVPEHRAATAIFFEDFLRHLQKPETQKMFLKLSRLVRTGAATKSPFSNLLNTSNFADRIEKVVDSGEISAFQEHLLMEHGLLLLQTDHAKAIQTFEKIAHSGQNKYALHQLAEWYSHDPTTYSKAKQYYLDILNNDPENIHALTGLYRLASRCREEGIQLNFDDLPNKLFNLDAAQIVSELTLHSAVELIGSLIEQQELETASTLLNNLKGNSPEIGKFHLAVAKHLPFNYFNVPVKEQHYQDAMSMDEQNYLHPIEYALFLYRLSRFAEASDLIKRTASRYSSRSEWIWKMYKSRLFFLDKLYFDQIPPRYDLPALEAYLLQQYQRTKSMITPVKHQATESDDAKRQRLLKGLLILRTVAYHSNQIFPSLHFKSLSRMATCHSQNGKFPEWNDLSPAENFDIAENIFDSLLAANQTNWEVNQNLCYNLREVIAISQDESLRKRKLHKLLKCCNQILVHRENRETPEFYRHRAFAKQGLAYFEGQLSDSALAMEHCTLKLYKDERMHTKELSMHTNNFILALCNCLSARIPTGKYHLFDTVRQYYILKHLDPNYKYLEQTRSKILEVDKHAFHKYHQRRPSGNKGKR